jgi:hypothetical protein
MVRWKPASSLFALCSVWPQHCIVRDGGSGQKTSLQMSPSSVNSSRQFFKSFHVELAADYLQRGSCPRMSSGKGLCCRRQLSRGTPRCKAVKRPGSKPVLLRIDSFPQGPISRDYPFKKFVGLQMITLMRTNLYLKST